MAAEKARKKRSGQSPRKNPFKGMMRRDRELRRFLRSGDGITIHTSKEKEEFRERRCSAQKAFI